MSLTPYYDDGQVKLFLGDMREVVPALAGEGLQADCMVADPPYGETSLPWDRWPTGWLDVAATVTRSLWCFGSLRMFGERWQEFGAMWKLSHEAECEWIDHVAWEKHNGSGPGTDRMRKVHEIAAHFYRGAWRDIYHVTPVVPATPEQVARNGSAVRIHGVPHRGDYSSAKGWRETGWRCMRSVIRVTSMHGAAIHPTQKPAGILTPLIEYACPAAGLVIDPFAGSGSTLMAARLTGRRAVGIEASEGYCEAAARWLSQMAFDFGEVS